MEKPTPQGSSDECEDEAGVEGEAVSPPNDVNEDDLGDWLIEEAGEAFQGLVFQQGGGLHLATPAERSAVPCKDFVWPSPKRKWRLVVLEEHLQDGEWVVVSVDCNCGRHGATGRHCAHVFRALDAAQCHVYKREWVHQHWLPEGQPVSLPSLPRTSMPPAARALPPTVDTSATSDALVNELHVGIAKSYGNSMLEVVYRGTSGPSDPVAIQRMQAAGKIFKWMMASSGQVLVDIVSMMEAKEVAEASQSRAASANCGGDPSSSSTDGGGVTTQPCDVLNAWEKDKTGGGRAAVARGSRKARQPKTARATTKNTTAKATPRKKTKTSQPHPALPGAHTGPPPSLAALAAAAENSEVTFRDRIRESRERDGRENRDPFMHVGTVNSGHNIPTMCTYRRMVDDPSYIEATDQVMASTGFHPFQSYFGGGGFGGLGGGGSGLGSDGYRSRYGW